MMAANRTWLQYRRSAEQGLSFRRFVARDLAFLKSLYASTRADELAQTPWSEAEKEEFLNFQFDAQHRHYMEHYPDADWLIVKLDRTRIGRLYLERWPSQHRIIDISLMGDYRSKGLGAAMMLDVMDEAAEAGKAVSIHVEKNNPAMHLYKRLGFTATEDKGVYDLMIWRPDKNATPLPD